jgi:hypothetical protein
MRGNAARRKQLTRFPCAVTGALSCLCSMTQISGPTTEGGNPQIIAVIVDTDKNAVPNAIVSVLKMAPDADSIQQ